MIAVGFSRSNFKAGFFDRTAVLRQMDRKTRIASSRWGAFVRQRSRTSIRRPGKKAGPDAVSAPGRPPLSHTDRLKRGIQFAWDSATRSVVVGPELDAGAKRPGTPERLEEGGIDTREVNGVVTVLRYKARPYMQPAFEKELPNAPSQWAEGIETTTER